MNIHKSFTHALRSAAILGLIAASSSLFAGDTFKITNTSNQPWCLRISEDPMTPVMVQGSMNQTPVELSPQQKLVYHIQPGETCILQFKDMKDLPKKKDVGLVDKAGNEKGALRLETRKAESAQTLASCPDEGIKSSLAILTDTPNVLNQDAEDAVSITAPTWN